MKKKVRHDTFLQCDDPSIAESLKQGDVIRVIKSFKGEPITVDFIVKFFSMKDEYNGNWMIECFTQQLNKMLSKPKGYNLEESIVINEDNIKNFRFCTLGYKRWNMARAARGIANKQIN